jgi:1-deoxy-D-xylulose-5-phosphate reductoisomerase
LNLAYEALKIGGSMTAVLNSANEAVVDLFLQKKVKFVEIPKIIEKFMREHDTIGFPSLEELDQIEEEIKLKIGKMVG